MSFDPSNILRDIDQLEGHSRTVRRKLADIEQRIQQLKAEIDTIKKSIEENRIKEKDQIKQIAQLDQRINTASERSSILRDRTDETLAEKEKGKVINQNRSTQLCEERSRLANLIDLTTHQIDEDYKICNENTASQMINTLKEQIRNQEAKNRIGLSTTGTSEQNEHLQELEVEKQALLEQIQALEKEMEGDIAYSGEEEGDGDIRGLSVKQEELADLKREDRPLSSSSEVPEPLPSADEPSSSSTPPPSASEGSEEENQKAISATQEEDNTSNVETSDSSSSPLHRPTLDQLLDMKLALGHEIEELEREFLKIQSAHNKEEEEKQEALHSQVEE